MSKYLFYDLETTGVKHYKNGIHQIAGLVVIDDEVVEEFNIKVKPYRKAEIEDTALKIGHVTREIVEGYMPTIDGKKKLDKILNKYVNKYDKKDKFFLCGYNNAGFDDKFLRAFYEYNDDPYFGSMFWPAPLDVYVLAAWHLRGVRRFMPDFKLGTVARKLGIEFRDDEAHDALYDVRKTKEILDILEFLG